MKNQTHTLSPNFKSKVLAYFNEGHTAKKISIELNEDYRKETGKNLTRNACIGIKFRAGKCQAVSRPDMSLHSKPPKGFKIKVCLKCSTEKWIEEHNRICPSCKKSKAWRAVTGLSSNEVYI